MKPLHVCNTSSNRRSCAGSVMPLTREELLVSIAQGMNIDMMDNFTDDILQIVFIPAEI